MAKTTGGKAIRWIPTLRERKEITYMLPTMLDNILDRTNLNEAYKQVVKNKGVAGVDGMTIDEQWGYLAENREAIISSIRVRKYKPKPMLRVDKPKPDGRKRLLDIPTYVDRVIQQAIAQVLTKVFDSKFSEYSYEFRHKRYAEMAIIQTLEYMNDGYDWMVDIDLERFFDMVNHDRLMNLISRKVEIGRAH